MASSCSDSKLLLTLLFLTVAALVLVDSAVFFPQQKRNLYKFYNNGPVQMQQKETPNQELADQAVTDLMNYWKHMKEIHSFGKYRTGPLNIVQFSWSDCGQSGDPMHISQFSVGPDPLKLPGNVSVSIHGMIKEALVAPIQVNLEVYKKVLIWVKIPCIDNLGSCTYADGCAMNPFKDKPCPPIFVQTGIPCKCPVKQGTYNLDQASFLVNPQGIPAWLEDGSYRVTVHLARNGKEFGCVNMAFSLTK